MTGTKYFIVFFLFLSLFINVASPAQTDTLRVMAYNVLNYGAYPTCQGPNSNYHAYLETIVQYANPDIVGLEKMGAIKLNNNDTVGNAPVGFADSVLDYALNAAYPGRFAYCLYTNNAQGSTMSVLFYNQQKLGFVAIASSYSLITDFNTYKLYYKDPNLAATHDTTFLYVTLNHTNSGSDNNNIAIRSQQITGEMQTMKTHFSSLPNMLNMGDFNLRYSYEPLYDTLAATPDTNFLFYDPPFIPDHIFTYPADWDDNPEMYAAYLTTSTRESATVPNGCGTDGGAKDWYDHIFFSSQILNNTDHISYIPGSYRTVGNDGNRVGISINDNSAITNTSAPADVINAIFQMSNKYPVMLSLEVNDNTGATKVNTIAAQSEHISVVNPVTGTIILHCTPGLTGDKITVVCYDTYGRTILKDNVVVSGSQVSLPCNLLPGVYFIKVYSNDAIILQTTVVKL